MAIDLVYIYRKQHEDLELKTSFRSLSNLKIDIGKIWIIGYLPTWMKNVNHIPAKDSYKYKNQNAIKKLLIACNHPEISEEFVLMNDDFFFLKPVNKIPFYTRKKLTSTLETYQKRYGSSRYIYAMKNTLKLLGDDAIDYEIHFPIRINKKNFIKAMNGVSWRKKPYLHRSIYGNRNKLTPTPTQDFKTYNLIQFIKKTRNDKFISLDNRVAITRQFKMFAKRHFGKKSIYEK